MSFFGLKSHRENLKIFGNNVGVVLDSRHVLINIDFKFHIHKIIQTNVLLVNLNYKMSKEESKV